MSQAKVRLDRILDKGDHTLYLFCKEGVYFGVDIENAKVMHALLGDIIEDHGGPNDTESRTTQ